VTLAPSVISTCGCSVYLESTTEFTQPTQVISGFLRGKAGAGHVDQISATGVGAFPIMTTMWRNPAPGERFRYCASRAPLIVLFGHVTVFAVAICLTPLLRDPRRHWLVPDWIRAGIFHGALAHGLGVGVEDFPAHLILGTFAIGETALAVRTITNSIPWAGALQRLPQENHHENLQTDQR
jgi:hypothetical protein